VPTRIEKLTTQVANFFFPQFCIGCGREGSILCQSCAERLPRLVAPFCPRCGLPQSGSGPCRDCAGLELAIDGFRSPLIFEKLSREAVHQLKYQNIRVLARPFAALLNDYLTEFPIPADVLVPVPLHPNRLKERGYNQSLLLARELSRLNGVPVDASSLKRIIHTTSQARTSSSRERHRNMLGAFKCGSGIGKSKRVLLIDDVSTSGATLDACARALKAAGAVSVWGLTVAREI
jgi:ComF family protein